MPTLMHPMLLSHAGSISEVRLEDRDAAVPVVFMSQRHLVGEIPVVVIAGELIYANLLRATEMVTGLGKAVVYF